MICIKYFRIALKMYCILMQCATNFKIHSFEKNNIEINLKTLFDVHKKLKQY